MEHSDLKKLYKKKFEYRKSKTQNNGNQYFNCNSNINLIKIHDYTFSLSKNI